MLQTHLFVVFALVLPMSPAQRETSSESITQNNMLTNTDDSVRVAVPVFPLGEDNSALYDFYDKFTIYVGSSRTLSMCFYRENYFELPTFPTDATDDAAAIQKFMDANPDVDTAQKFRAASIRCCNKMKFMIKHHPEIVQLIINAKDSVKTAWKSILALAHVNLKEYVNKTRLKIMSNISDAKDF